MGISVAIIGGDPSAAGGSAANTSKELKFM
jgi:hypothetical protein